ncbi:hypothetical protein SAMN05216603_10612 [Pseudomonas benzenivorans]|nr:hypothetical protein SAMN05216603_10612 [Pseudomonas benzenivorans]
MHSHRQCPRGLALAPAVAALAWPQPEPAGRLQSVPRQRRSMPSIVAVEPGHCLLAEQGRNRTLQPNRLTAGF